MSSSTSRRRDRRFVFMGDEVDEAVIMDLCARQTVNLSEAIRRALRHHLGSMRREEERCAEFADAIGP